MLRQLSLACVRQRLVLARTSNRRVYIYSRSTSNVPIEWTVIGQTGSRRHSSVSGTAGGRRGMEQLAANTSPWMGTGCALVCGVLMEETAKMCVGGTRAIPLSGCGICRMTEVTGSSAPAVVIAQSMDGTAFSPACRSFGFCAARSYKNSRVTSVALGSSASRARRQSSWCSMMSGYGSCRLREETYAARDCRVIAMASRRGFVTSWSRGPNFIHAGH
ncbi:unnamed protein product [Mycena citricolor]|uniref:Uncharacterized protein n=1 Tax=Mycena citricolor TaxID=2018698 RepID=A0AAD2GVI6_9AGAR|nr:unnamed protein product [Mycena citricolor]